MAQCWRGNPVLTLPSWCAQQNCWGMLWLMYLPFLPSMTLYQKCRGGGWNNVKVSGTHCFVLSATHAEKSQCTDEQHRFVVQNMLLWGGESAEYKALCQATLGWALASRWKGEIPVLICQDKNPSFLPCFHLPLSNSMTKFFSLYSVSCFLTLSFLLPNIPLRSRAVSPTSARNCNTHWEWMLWVEMG